MSVHRFLSHLEWIFFIDLPLKSLSLLILHQYDLNQAAINEDIEFLYDYFNINVSIALFRICSIQNFVCGLCESRSRLVKFPHSPILHGRHIGRYIGRYIGRLSTDYRSIEIQEDLMFNSTYFFSYEATCVSLNIACHPVLICLGGLCKCASLCQHEVMVSWDSSIKFFRKFALSAECPWAY